MLALRSVLSEAPPVLIFDEVDAGIGGQAGFAVGRSLSHLGDRHQVLVVTHLPQVAAFADAHLAVEKRQGDDDTVSEVRLLDPGGPAQGSWPACCRASPSRRRPSSTLASSSWPATAARRAD